MRTDVFCDAMQTGASDPRALSELTTGHVNDMIVDRQGRAFVGNFGFDLMGGEIGAGQPRAHIPGWRRRRGRGRISGFPTGW